MNKPSQKRYPLAIYFLLACGISWAFMIPAFVIAEQQGYELLTNATFGVLMKGGFQNSRHIWLVVIGTLSSYGPLVAALILSLLEDGKRGLRAWWQRCTHIRIGAGGYRDLLLIFLVIFAPLALIGLLLGPLSAAGVLAAPLAYILPYTLYELLTAGLEEPGWRGYALPRLQERYPAAKSSLILGLVWGVWHWPAFIPVYFNALAQPGTPIIAAFIQAAVQALTYIFASVLAAAFIHTWLYNRTRSAFPNWLLHGGSNALGGYLMAVVPNPALGMLYGVIRWLVAIVLLKRFWREPGIQSSKEALASPA